MTSKAGSVTPTLNTVDQAAKRLVQNSPRSLMAVQLIGEKLSVAVWGREGRGK